MKDFFTESEIERINELEDVGDIPAWLLIQEPKGQLCYIDLSEPDIFWNKGDKNNGKRTRIN